jgi:hypothetical protein
MWAGLGGDHSPPFSAEVVNEQELYLLSSCASIGVLWDSFTFVDYMAWMMNWKGFGRGSRDLILRYYPGIRLEGLRKTTKTLNPDSRSRGPRYEFLTSRIRKRSVNHSTTTFDN